jgi:hypothetical protein
MAKHRNLGSSTLGSVAGPRLCAVVLILLPLSGCMTGSSASLTQAPLFFAESADEEGNILPGAHEAAVELASTLPTPAASGSVAPGAAPTYLAVSGNAALPVRLAILSPAGPIRADNGLVTAALGAAQIPSVTGGHSPLIRAALSVVPVGSQLQATLLGVVPATAAVATGALANAAAAATAVAGPAVQAVPPSVGGVTASTQAIVQATVAPVQAVAQTTAPTVQQVVQATNAPVQAIVQATAAPVQQVVQTIVAPVQAVVQTAAAPAQGIAGAVNAAVTPVVQPVAQPVVAAVPATVSPLVTRLTGSSLSAPALPGATAPSVRLCGLTGCR